MKFNYKILHNYGNFLAVLKEIIFNVCEVRRCLMIRQERQYMKHWKSLEEKE